MTLNTAIIYGSVRGQRAGIGVARFLAGQLHERGHTTTLVDPLEHPLPLLDRMYKEFKAGEAPPSMARVGEILDAADGYVIVSGEYNHGEPPALKNLLDHFQKEYHYKPSAIATYSAGPFGGVRALITLRAILAELGTPSIPSAFPVSLVGKSFATDGTVRDEAYARRVGKFLDEYEWYAKALKAAREHGCQREEAPTQQVLCRG